jgi:hypothetical protein
MRRHLTALSLLLLLGGAVAPAAVHAQTPIRTVWRPILVPAPIGTTTGTNATQQAPAPRPGLLRCVAEDNGVPGDASVELLQNGRSVARGSCSNPISVPAGAYTAVVTLEGVLDRPRQSVPVMVGEGAESIARASFRTAILEVRFTDQGATAYGIAEVRRGGVVVGTLGNGVAARVSAGTYQVVARYRMQERVFDVTLDAGDRRALRAAF